MLLRLIQVNLSVVAGVGAELLVLEFAKSACVDSADLVLLDLTVRAQQTIEAAVDDKSVVDTRVAEVVAVEEIGGDRVDLVASAHVEAEFGLAILVVQHQVESVLDETIYEGSDPYLDINSKERRVQVDYLRASNIKVNLLNEGVLLDIVVIVDWEHVLKRHISFKIDAQSNASQFS